VCLTLLREPAVMCFHHAALTALEEMVIVMV